MNIVFLGVTEKKKKGCNCGGRKNRTQFQYTKEYTLLSGIRKKFRVGRIETVSDEDGAELLSYTYDSPEGEKHVFEEV